MSENNNILVLASVAIVAIVGLVVALMFFKTSSAAAPVVVSTTPDESADSGNIEFTAEEIEVLYEGLEELESDEENLAGMAAGGIKCIRTKLPNCYWCYYSTSIMKKPTGKSMNKVNGYYVCYGSNQNKLRYI